MNIFYSGIFGRRAAQAATALCDSATLIDMQQDDALAAARQPGAGQAVVMLSDAAGAQLEQLAAAFRAAGTTWTAVQLYPSMVRVGPLVKADGVCFSCATKRYLSAPGSEGLARLEELLRGASASRPIAFPVVPVTVVEMAVAEAMRQLADPETPAGFMMKADFVEHTVASAVARAMHGCSCGGASRHGPGERFYADLEQDMLALTGDIAR